jgi:hypothetical protein
MHHARPPPIGRDTDSVMWETLDERRGTVR